MTTEAERRRLFGYRGSPAKPAPTPHQGPARRDLPQQAKAWTSFNGFSVAEDQPRAPMFARLDGAAKAKAKSGALYGMPEREGRVPVRPPRRVVLPAEEQDFLQEGNGRREMSPTRLGMTPREGVEAGQAQVPPPMKKAKSVAKAKNNSVRASSSGTNNVKAKSKAKAKAAVQQQPELWEGAMDVDEQEGEVLRDQPKKKGTTNAKKKARADAALDALYSKLRNSMGVKLKDFGFTGMLTRTVFFVQKVGIF